MNFLLFFATIFIQSNVVWLSSSTFDFGKIDHRKPVVTTFSFKNESNQPILIDNVRTDCGCTSPEWPSEPIAQQEKGIITVRFNAWKRGVFNKRIKVYFHGVSKPDILTIKGEVIDEEEK